MQLMLHKLNKRVLLLWFGVCVCRGVSYCAEPCFYRSTDHRCPVTDAHKEHCSCRGCYPECRAPSSESTHASFSHSAESADWLLDRFPANQKHGSLTRD